MTIEVKKNIVILHVHISTVLTSTKTSAAASPERSDNIKIILYDFCSYDLFDDIRYKLPILSGQVSFLKFIKMF